MPLGPDLVFVSPFSETGVDTVFVAFSMLFVVSVAAGLVLDPISPTYWAQLSRSHAKRSPESTNSGGFSG